jgi:membrane associated rhomboid family serine protease
MIGGMDAPETRPGKETATEIGRTLRTQLLLLGGFVAAIWFLEIADWLFWRGGLDNLGIRPRLLVGLRGILFMPFLHSSFDHVLANTIPFILLGWLVMIRRTADFLVVTAVVMLVSGLGVWLTGPAGSVHIGASGLIFGYFGFLLVRSYFERSLFSVVITILVVFLYGGLVWGVLPGQNGVSWQAHLFGLVGGALAARWLAGRDDLLDSSS